MQIYSAAIKLECIFGLNEDTYFNLFKVIEVIVKDDFRIEKDNGKLDKGSEKIKEFINHIHKSTYKISIDDETLKKIIGETTSTLFEASFYGINPKISWYLNRNGISMDANLLKRATSLRNDIAHGEYVEILKMTDEYSAVMRLSKMCIWKKFFKEINNLSIQSTIKLT